MYNLGPQKAAGNATDIPPNFIDFAVVGFEKSGTTFLLSKVLEPSKQVYMAGGEEGEEVHELDRHQLGLLYERFRPHLHQRTADGAPVQMGFKQPMVLLDRKLLRNLHDNFPNIQMVVTMRHPILWFQSWYNYKLRQGKLGNPAATPHQMVGLCGEACRKKGPEGQCITLEHSLGCSGHGYFHQYLSRLDFTDKNTEDELRLLDHTEMKSYPFPKTRVFVTEIGQLEGRNVTLSNGLMRALEGFLGLQPHALPDAKAYRQPKYKYTQDEMESRIDICNSKYNDIRSELLQQSKKASKWIERYFLKSPQVVVFDQPDFLTRIREWRLDPCQSRETVSS